MAQNDIDYRNLSESNHTMQPEPVNTTDKDSNQNEYQYPYYRRRKRRNEFADREASAQYTDTPKRRHTAQFDNRVQGPRNIQVETTMPSYFNNNRIFRKQTNESSRSKQTNESSRGKNTNESSSGKQYQRESYPPFRIKMKDDEYPEHEVTIIKELNKKSKLNLTYGRMSTPNNNKYYLLYCNTATQFETLLDKANWPDTICNCEYSFDLPRRIPSSYSLVVLDVSIQWDVQSFCDELKLRYKTIIKCERLFVKGGRPIPKLRIDFSSNKELTEILRDKRILLDDENTAYKIEPYIVPTRILRCYICQQYDSHIAARCPNKDKPICFKCGEQHSYNPECQNAICCAHCKGSHMAGNPNCPQKIETRELKKMQMKVMPATELTYPHKWTGNAVHHLFNNETSAQPMLTENTNTNNHVMRKLDAIQDNIQTILKQQTDLHKQLNDINIKINNQAAEILNNNYILYDIVCPLLKDVTNIIYSQINSQQKHQINPVYNRLVSFLDQKGSNHVPFHTQNDHNLYQQQIASNLQPNVASNEDSIVINDEPRR